MNGNKPHSVVDTNIRFIVPEYCKFYKPVLVDEFAFVSSPLLLHYGKCSAIGRTEKDPKTQRTYLGSIRLVGLSRQYQCPDGSSRVPLHTLSFGKDIPENTTVNVFGEAVLYDTSMPEHSMDNLVPTTSKELMMTIGKRQTDLEEELGLPPRPPSGLTDRSLHSSVRLELHKQLLAINQRFEPTILVHSYNRIDEPHALITANLRLAKIRKARDAKQGLRRPNLSS